MSVDATGGMGVLDQPVIAGLARTVRTLAAGAVLFRRGDRVAAMYVVDAGQIDLTRTLEDGTTLLLASYGSGRLAAEASLFSATYHCDAVAATPARVWRIAKAGLLQALHQEPQAALALLAQQAQAIQALRTGTELRNLRPLSARVLAWLELQQAGRSGWVQPPDTWKSVAQSLGASHEALYRCLAGLEAAGSIERQGGRVRRKPRQGV